MTTQSSFHPIQSLRHLCNRLDSNAAVRDSVLAEIGAEQKRHYETMQELNAQLVPLADKRKILLEEGKELLPSLRGFGKCYETLKGILNL